MLSSYPIGKTSSEFLNYAYFKEYNVPTKVVRPSSIQGLYQKYSEDRVFNQILRCIIENKNLILKSKGESQKSIIYTLDAVMGILIVLFKGENGEAYNLTNMTTFFSIYNLASTLFKKFNSNLKIEFDIKEENETGYLPPLSILQSTEKIEKLGWEPITNIYDIYDIDIRRFKEYGKN